MNHLAMKTLYALILVLMAGTAYGQSNLPACQGSDSSKWSNCLGIQNYPNGNKYIGAFKDGNRSGQGTFTNTNGDTYFGDWKDDMRNGEGSFTKANSDKYIGEWKENNFNGQGTFIFANGNKYVGEFTDDKRNGKGIEYSADGRIEKSGIYKDNKLITPQYIDPNSFTRIARNNSAPAVADSRRQEIEQERKSSGSTFGEIILKTNPNKLPLCSERLGTRQSPIKCWGEERRDRWSYVGEMENYGVDGQGQPAGKYHGQGVMVFTDGSRQEGIWFNGQLLSKSKLNIPNFDTNTANNSERNDLQRDQQKLAEERRKLEEDKRQREQAKLNQRTLLQVNNSQPSAEGDFTINIQTNADTASLRVNGEEQGGRADGKYSVKRVARAGQETRFEIIAKDVYGNTDTKTISVSRVVVESKVTYQQLNPARIKRQPERDAVAVIIGISNYKSLPKAEFAKDDAQVFFDYAIRALGVKPGNIKLLMDEQADAEEIYTAFKTWLPARVKSTTDVYVFYSGHGLPTQDGSGLYWLPQRANRDLISKTGILLTEINGDIQASKPKSVTIFMDACYSGQARGGETLVASARPIALKSQPTTFPNNFTVISASQADQISSSSPELQHGIFSYYLMRGMEGEADLNKDGKITLDEIQKYLSENVGRQARIMNRQQEPQVIGDGSRVLVGR